jgi:hypothetical protein
MPSTPMMLRRRTRRPWPAVNSARRLSSSRSACFFFAANGAPGERWAAPRERR